MTNAKRAMLVCAVLLGSAAVAQAQSGPLDGQSFGGKVQVNPPGDAYVTQACVNFDAGGLVIEGEGFTIAISIDTFDLGFVTVWYAFPFPETFTYGITIPEVLTTYYFDDSASSFAVRGLLFRSDCVVEDD